MDSDWNVPGFKARMDSAIAGERWNEADQVRIAAKLRMMELTIGGHAKAVEQARDGLADSFETLRLSKRIRIRQDALSTATKLSADGETYGIAAELVPLPLPLARNVKEAILHRLSRGNRAPMSSSELARQAGYRPETVARALALLRDEGKVVSRRMGRHVLHRVPSEPSGKNSVETLAKADKFPSDDTVRAQNDGSSFEESWEIRPRASFESTAPAVKQRLSQSPIAKWHPSMPEVLTPEAIIDAQLRPAKPDLMVRANPERGGVPVNEHPSIVEPFRLLDKLGA